MEWFISYMDEESIDTLEYYDTEEEMTARLQNLRSQGLAIWDYGKEHGKRY